MLNGRAAVTQQNTAKPIVFTTHTDTETSCPTSSYAIVHYTMLSAGVCSSTPYLKEMR